MSELTRPLSSTCASCGTENDQSRRFCARCGEWLITPVTPDRPPAPFRGKFRENLRRRWFGDRGPYTGQLSRATVGFRVLSGVAFVVILTAVLALVGLHPIQRVKDEIGHIRGTGRVTGLTATAEPPGAPPDPSPAWAVDNVRARGWSTQWTSATAGDPDAACRSGAAPATATALVITFPDRIDVREIGFEAGLVKPNERDNRWQPQTLELRWQDGECQVVDLKNTPDLQRFRVSRQQVDGVVGVSGVRVTVVAGYRPADPGPDNGLDLAEVIVWRR